MNLYVPAIEFREAKPRMIVSHMPTLDAIRAGNAERDRLCRAATTQFWIVFFVGCAVLAAIYFGVSP